MGSRYKLFMTSRLVRVAPIPATVDAAALEKLFTDFTVSRTEIIGGAGYLHLQDFED